MRTRTPFGLTGEEALGLFVAIAAHIALIVALVLSPLGRKVQPPPQRMTVSLSDTVADQATSPKPDAQAAPDLAPDLGEPDHADQPLPPAPQPVATPEPRPVPKPAPRPEPKSEPKPVPRPVAKPEPKPEPKPVAKPEPKPKPVAKVEHKVEPKVEAKAASKARPDAKTKPEAKPEVKPEQGPQAVTRARIRTRPSRRVAARSIPTFWPVFPVRPHPAPTKCRRATRLPRSRPPMSAVPFRVSSSRTGRLRRVPMPKSW